MIRKAKVKEGAEVPVHQRRRGNMKSGHFALGLLLFASIAASQQYVISTYAGGAPAPIRAIRVGPSRAPRVPSTAGSGGAGDGPGQPGQPRVDAR